MFHSLRCLWILLVGLLVMITLSALPASAGTQVPFKASLPLVSHPATNNAGCPSKTIRFNVTEPGIASHMGKVTVSEYVCLNVDLTFVANFTLTAANGDQLTASAAGYGVPTSQTTFNTFANWTINGGTGRFDGATGNGTATGEVNLVTGASPQMALLPLTHHGPVHSVIDEAKACKQDVH